MMKEQNTKLFPNLELGLLADTEISRFLVGWTPTFHISESLGCLENRAIKTRPRRFHLEAQESRDSEEH